MGLVGPRMTPMGPSHDPLFIKFDDFLLKNEKPIKSPIIGPIRPVRRAYYAYYAIASMAIESQH